MNRINSLIILLSILAVVSAQDICERGGSGIFFPLFNGLDTPEYDWNKVR